MLFGMRSDARDMATDSDPEVWMWTGKQTEAVLANFAREGEQQQLHCGWGGCARPGYRNRSEA